MIKKFLLMLSVMLLTSSVFAQLDVDGGTPERYGSNITAHVPPINLSGYLNQSLSNKIRYDLLPTTDLRYWSTYDTTAGIFIVNSNFFLGTNLDFSGCSFYNGFQGGGGSATLISSNIAILASHTYGPSNGVWYTFVGRNGQRVWSQSIASFDIPYQDIRVTLLDPPLPSTNFTYYKTFPLDYHNYFTNHYAEIAYNYGGADIGTLCIVGAQRDGANTGNYPFGVQEIVGANWLRWPPSIHPEMWPWELYILGGDSSHPTFFVFGNELAFLGPHIYSSGDDIVIDFYSSVTNAIAYLTGGNGDVIKFINLNTNTFINYKP
jgi:hypothetical protein